jgi:hypothetical protein
MNSKDKSNGILGSELQGANTDVRATVTYKNPWHKPSFGFHYGLELFETDAKPVAHVGYLIYERIKGHVWDVVKDGVCVHPARRHQRRKRSC